MKLNFFAYSLIVLTIFTALSCNSSVESVEKTEQKLSKPPASKFEEDLNYARTSNMRYIMVFRRKDGKPFDKDEIAYLKKNSPVQINQWLGGKEYVVAVSNFEFVKEDYAALLKHFTIENFSGSDDGTSGVQITEIPADAKTRAELYQAADELAPISNANSNANANAKANKTKP